MAITTLLGSHGLSQLRMNLAQCCCMAMAPAGPRDACNRQRSALRRAPKHLPRVEMTIWLLYISSISKCVGWIYIQTKCHQLFV